MASMIPKPIPDGDSKPFWEGVQNHELLIQQCQDCHQHIFYPRSICPHCFSEDLSWLKSSGQGSIYSYTVVHKAFGPFREQTPYVVAIVELDEGVRMMSRIIGDRTEIAIGKPVEATFEVIDEDLTLPYFKLA